MKELMGTLSPAYGMATGEGLFGNAVGLLPAIAKDMRDEKDRENEEAMRLIEEQEKRERGMKKGGAVKKMKKGGMVKSSASKRADGIAVKGKTRGRMV